MDVESALLYAIAPAHLADAIVGDLVERRANLTQTVGRKRASAISRADALRSLPSLITHSSAQALTNNWTTALTAAAVTEALCLLTMPIWEQIGLGGAVFHVLRLAIIGFALGCIPRASSLSCAFLLAMIGITNCAIDAREADGIWPVLSGTTLYWGILLDGAAMASAVIVLRIVRLIRALRR